MLEKNYISVFEKCIKLENFVYVNNYIQVFDKCIKILNNNI